MRVRTQEVTVFIRNSERDNPRKSEYWNRNKFRYYVTGFAFVCDLGATISIRVRVIGTRCLFGVRNSEAFSSFGMVQPWESEIGVTGHAHRGTRHARDAES